MSNESSSSDSEGLKNNALWQIILQQREQKKAEKLANGWYKRDTCGQPECLFDGEITRMEEERIQREMEVASQLKDRELQKKNLEEKAQSLMHQQMVIMKDSTILLQKRNEEYRRMLMDQEKRRSEENAYRKEREEVDREILEEERELEEMKQRRIAKQKLIEELKMQNVEYLQQQVLAAKKENEEKHERRQQHPIAEMPEKNAHDHRDDLVVEEAEGEQNLVRNEEFGQIEDPVFVPQEAQIVPRNDIMGIMADEVEPVAVDNEPRIAEVAAPPPQKRGRGRPPKRAVPVEPIPVAVIAPEDGLNAQFGNENQEEVADAVAGDEVIEVAAPPPLKRGRGRPPKNKPVAQVQPQAQMDAPRGNGNQDEVGDAVAGEEVIEIAVPPPPKRGRGRPPKILPVALIQPQAQMDAPRGNGNQDEVGDAVAEEDDVEVAAPPPPMLGRGRPPKIRPVAQIDAPLGNEHQDAVVDAVAEEDEPVAVGNEPRNGDLPAPPPQKRGRGRPPKAKGPPKAKRPVGRPKKAVSGAKRPVGRPRKDAK